MRRILAVLRAFLRNATPIILAQAVALAPIASALAAEPIVVGIEAIGTAFRATLSDGSVRQGSDLAGAVLVFDIAGQRLRIRIAAITPDPIDRTGSVLLHDFRIAETDAPLCSP